MVKENVNNTENEDVKAQETEEKAKSPAEEVAKAPAKLSTVEEGSKPKFDLTTADGLAAAKAWLEDRAKKSAIKNQMFCSKLVLIDEGKESEYGLLLHFPGVTEASNIETRAFDQNGNISIGDLMKGAVEKGVIVSPHIDDVDTFANTHKSFGEAARSVMNFLDDGIKGQLK